jgi:hypothetical protein
MPSLAVQTRFFHIAIKRSLKFDSIETAADRTSYFYRCKRVVLLQGSTLISEPLLATNMPSTTASRSRPIERLASDAKLAIGRDVTRSD